MLVCLSLNIACYSKLTVFLELCSRKTVRILEKTMSTDKYLYIFVHIFAPKRGYCFYMHSSQKYLNSCFTVGPKCRWVTSGHVPTSCNLVEWKSGHKTITHISVEFNPFTVNCIYNKLKTTTRDSSFNNILLQLPCTYLSRGMLNPYINIIMNDFVFFSFFSHAPSQNSLKTHHYVTIDVPDNLHCIYKTLQIISTNVLKAANG